MIKISSLLILYSVMLVAIPYAIVSMLDDAVRFRYEYIAIGPILAGLSFGLYLIFTKPKHSDKGRRD